MTRNIQPSMLPIRAHLTSIKVVGDLEGNSSTTRRDHFAIVYVDEKEVAKSNKKKPREAALQWEWPEDHRFGIHPSSTIKIVVYRMNWARINKRSIGQHVGRIIDLLENDRDITLQDKTGTETASKIKINLSLIFQREEVFDNFMANVGAAVSRLDGAVQVPPVTLALGRALQLTKAIMDIVANADSSPILKASWSAISVVYTAIEHINIQDDTVRDLVEKLKEILGIAKECPDLLLIKGMGNVIEEIARMSLKVASLLHEYTRPTFMPERTFNSKASDAMKLRIAKCQKSCDNLKQRFSTRVNLNTNAREAKAQDLVTEIKGTIKDNNTNIQSTSELIRDEELAKKIFDWLSAPDSSKNYKEAREKHQKNTFCWFLEGERFRKLQKRADILWIKGTAGCGKTILCSSIIDKIIQLQEENTSIGYAYFFFDGRDSQNDLQLYDKFIRSLILQLSVQCDGIPAVLVQLYGRGLQQPSPSSLEATLYQIMDGMPLIYIDIDSLDECIEREKTLRWISETTSRQIGNLRMVVASRPERDISDILESLDPQCVNLVAEVGQDISIYLDQQLALVEKWDEETQKFIKSTLIMRAEGMFRWIALQLMELIKCSNRHEVMKQLNSLPIGLYETYDQILLKIGQQTDRTDTTTFLRWLCFSIRPMTLIEIAEAATIDFGIEDGPRYEQSQQYWDERDVLEKCAGLITESEGNIKLAHFSIKEYLLSEHLRTGPTSNFHLASEELSHSLISQTCLAYLLQFVDLTTNIGSSPLSLYATRYWIEHAKIGGIEKAEPSLNLTLAKKLFTPKASTFINCLHFWNLEENYTHVPEPKPTRSDITSFSGPLYYASLTGLHQLVQLLLKEEDVNAQGGAFGNALQAASFCGHDAVVKLLLDNGADINAIGGVFGNALQAASERGHAEIVKLLLENGADVNAYGARDRNALIAALYQDQQVTAELLLQAGVDVNAQTGEGDNGLHAASTKGYKPIVELLLKKGADVNAQGGYYGNALQAAAFKGDEAIVELLLENGANVNAQGGMEGNALQAALSKGHETIAKKLLESGADIHFQGGSYGNALQAASYKGDEAMVKLLLDIGVDVSVEGGFYGNALQAASHKGHLTIAKLLLQWGADMNALGGEYGHALQAASAEGHEATVKLLLEKGANVSAQGGFHGNALQAASAYGHSAVAKLLIDSGANVNERDGLYGYALHAALAEGHDITAQLLLEMGADVHAQGGYYDNALQAAASRGHEATVKMLLELGVDVNFQGEEHSGNPSGASHQENKAATHWLLLEQGEDLNVKGGIYGSALQAAAHQGSEKNVKLLLEKGANVNAQGGKYGNALQAASCKGRTAIVKLLLEKGADVNAQGGEYGNALQAASQRGKVATVNLLLKEGANVNAQGGKYGNALKAASTYPIEQLLLDNGAEIGTSS